MYRQNLEKANDQSSAAIGSMTMEQVTQKHLEFVKQQKLEALIAKYKPYVILTLKVLAVTALTYCLVKSKYCPKIDLGKLIANLQPSNAFER